MPFHCALSAGIGGLPIVVSTVWIWGSIRNYGNDMKWPEKRSPKYCTLRRRHHSNGGEVECQREGARNSSLERWWTLASLDLCDILVWHFMTYGWIHSISFKKWYPKTMARKMATRARDLMLVRTMNLPSHTLDRKDLRSCLIKAFFWLAYPISCIQSIVSQYRVGSSRLRWWLMVNCTNLVKLCAVSLICQACSHCSIASCFMCVPQKGSPTNDLFLKGLVTNSRN